MLIFLSWLPSGKHLLILRWASCGEKQLSTRRQDPEKKTCQRPQIAFLRLATRRHWFCTSASYVNQPDGCQTDRHRCNSIICDCCSLRLKQRRDRTSAHARFTISNCSSHRVVSKLLLRNRQGKIENATASKQRCFARGLHEQTASGRTTSPKRPHKR